MTEPRNETGKWLLQIGCHRGTLTSRDSATELHDTEEAARADFAAAMSTWARMGYQVWFASLVPPGALYKDAITLHPGAPYAH